MTLGVSALRICKEASNVFPNELWCLTKQIIINQRYLGNDTANIEICKKIIDNHQDDIDFSNYFFKTIVNIDSPNKTTQDFLKSYLKYVESDEEDYIHEYNRKYKHKPQKDEVYSYFLWAELTNRIKIGKSNDPYKRLKTLQTGSPEKLILIAFVSGDIERKLKEEFKKYKIHGEWFIPAPEILFKIIKLLMIELHGI